MAARKSKLGPDFWGNFYRIDNEQHIRRRKIRAELASVGVQTVLDGDCKINIFTVNFTILQYCKSVQWFYCKITFPGPV